MPSLRPAPGPRRRTWIAALIAVIGWVAAGAAGARAWLDGTFEFHAAPREGPLAPHGEVAGPPPPFLLVITDGLRAESAFALPTWSALAHEGASGVATTGEPTMSAPCIRSILSGRSPDLYSAFRNFAALETDGTLVELLVRRGARAAHAGDAVIPRLCGKWISPADAFVLAREEVRTAEVIDEKSFPVALEKARDPKVGVLTVHWVEVDLVGHAHGAGSPEYAEACARLDGRLASLVAAFRSTHPGATLLVASDHGLSSFGTHGGGEGDARRAPFLLVGPRVKVVNALAPPQTALAATVAAALGLESPPLAESPPILDALELTEAESIQAVDGFLRDRVAALSTAGRSEASIDLEKLRTGAFNGGRALADLSRLAAGVRPGDAPWAWGLFTAVLGIATLLLVVRAAGASLRDTLVVAVAAACCAGLAGAGAALQQTLMGMEEAREARLRVIAAIAVLVALALDLIVRRGRWRHIVGFFRGRPEITLAAAGGLAGFTLSMRLAIDHAVHTPILFAILAILLVGATCWSAGGRKAVLGPPWGALAIAVLWLGGSRLAQGLSGDAWIHAGARASLGWDLVLGVVVAVLLKAGVGRGAGAEDRADRHLALLLAACTIAFRLLSEAGAAAVGFSLLSSGVLLMSRIPGPHTRGGLVRMVLVLVAVRWAAFHALGHLEALSTIDPRGVLVPGASRAPTRADTAAVLEALSLVGRMALLWIVLLAGAARSLRRSGDAEGLLRLVPLLLVVLVAEAVVLPIGMASWWRWSWWAVIALPVYLLAGVDVLIVAGAGLLLAVLGRRPAPDPTVTDASSRGAKTWETTGTIRSAPS